MRDPDTLILAVVPAHTTRLTANQGIGLVIEHQKQAQTIIALTMTDLVQPPHVRSLVVDRLLERTDELAGQQFGGLVAVINRLHTDTEILREASEREAVWFETLLRGAPKDYQPHLPRLRSRVTVGSVIRHLDALFNGHICSNWRPRALATIDARIVECKAQLSKLGTPPESMKVSQVMDRAICVFREGPIYSVEDAVVAAVSELTAGLKGPAAEVPTEGALKSRLAELSRAHKAEQQREQERRWSRGSAPGYTVFDARRGMYVSGHTADTFVPAPFRPSKGAVSRIGWLQEAVTCVDELESRAEQWLAGGGVERVRTALEVGLAPAFLDDAMPVIPKRFVKVLLPALHAKLAAYWMEEGAPRLTSLIRERVAEARRPRMADPLAGLQDDLVAVVVSEVLRAVSKLPSMLQDDPELLQEEDSHARRRSELKARLEALKIHDRQILDIKEAIGDPDSNGDGDIAEVASSQENAGSDSSSSGSSRVASRSDTSRSARRQDHNSSRWVVRQNKP
jgi:hypothetical protein